MSETAATSGGGSKPTRLDQGVVSVGALAVVVVALGSFASKTIFDEAKATRAEVSAVKDAVLGEIKGVREQLGTLTTRLAVVEAAGLERRVRELEQDLAALKARDRAREK